MPPVRAGPGAQRRDRRPLAEAEPGLALGLEDRGDGPARGLLDRVVEIDERNTVVGGQPPPHGALPAPGGPISTRSMEVEILAYPVVPGAPSAVPAGSVRARYRSRLSRTSSSESPPNFSRTASANTRRTIASPITPAAGTTLMSLRS